LLVARARSPPSQQPSKQAEEGGERQALAAWICLRQRLDGEANEGGFMRRLALLLGLAAVVALGPGGVARAVPPEHFPVEHVDETFTIEDECSFTVLFHFEGDVRHTVFFDQEGNEVRELTVFPHFGATLINAETGKSISTVAPSVEHVTINPDGSAVLAVTGLSGHLIVGGGPPLSADVGRIVFFFGGPEDEEPDIIFQAGNFDMGPFPQLCDVLADP
jgi:hypothetical protein